MKKSAVVVYESLGQSKFPVLCSVCSGSKTRRTLPSRFSRQNGKVLELELQQKYPRYVDSF
jgi:hypothetical protein